MSSAPHEQPPGAAAANRLLLLRLRAYLAVLLATWYAFSYVFNAATKGWFRATEASGGGTIFPLMAVVFASNAVAASCWVMHLTGGFVRPAAALRGLGWVGHIIHSSACVDFCLLCVSGAVGITAAIVVLQHGSIQLVQVRRVCLHVHACSLAATFIACMHACMW